MATWNDQLKNLLSKKFGTNKGQELAKKYANSFPINYTDEYNPEITVEDIEQIEKLSAENPLQVFLYYSAEREYPLHIRLFQWQAQSPLSDVLPILENMDLRTYNERPNKITLLNNHVVWISDLALTYNKGKIDIKVVKDLFEDAFKHIYLGYAENDGFNKLILGALLSWREITILRFYAKYLYQTGFRFSQAYIEKALANNPHIAKDLVEMFITLHNPNKAFKATHSVQKIEERITQALNKVSSLDEDRIVRRLLDLINATLRTNYFQLTKDKQSKAYLSMKFNSAAIPELPLPVPLYEVFVYSTRFEAIHLRNTKVSRGGIRWSDRQEDFRTEILGLMKAQKVKNSIIVPSGAKGGFVLKKTANLTTREALQLEVIYCYSEFICGLLDITDNIVDDKFVRPPQVVCYDDEDPYLVVAADKGTATFSDIANELSAKYHFWLGDAFASGGSTGYDHKKMGITARGAWESIKRHFRELSVDVLTTNISVIGIGDMSGDVFGNGMLYTKHIKLIAAFDHRNIFIDPDPNPEISFYERERLFKLPISSWEDYNPTLISRGGGVFKRSLKSINLTTQMKEVLGTEETTLTPNELIKTILKAPVDLFYNGGIGTYVKATQETAADVGDRANDYCRINGDDLRCKVVGEGGNLGFTQLGRIEYALKGGLINTDFIDNSGGVDCSDHEVNLKILLDKEVHNGKLSEKKRNELLVSVTDEVAQLVLQDNYSQALVMSFSAFHAKRNIGLHTNYLKELEDLHVLNRKVEFLPDEKELLERKAAGEGLTRPELAVLLAYTKIHIKHEILDSGLPEDPYLHQTLSTAFPPSIAKKYKHAMDQHRLKRDIIATQLSNHVVNEMGITFVYRLQVETGAAINEIIRSYTVAAHIFGTEKIRKDIEALDFKIPMADQYHMLFNIRNLINISTRWFLHSTHIKGDLKELIERFSTRIQKLEDLIPDLMGGITREYLEKLVDQFLREGLQKETARKIATYRAIYTSLNIIEVATKYDLDLIKTAEVYFAAGERMNLLWFRDQLAGDTREGHWNSLARLTLRDELDISQRALTIAIMKNAKTELGTNQLIQHWMDHNKFALARWDHLLSSLHGSQTIDYTMFFIAIRELIGLIMTSHK